GFGALLEAQIRHQVGQRVWLDDSDDAQVGVSGFAADYTGDVVNVQRLVLVEPILSDQQFAVGSERRAVAVGQVVDDDADQVSALSNGCIQVPCEAPRITVRAVNSVDAVEPDKRVVLANVDHRLCKCARLLSSFSVNLGLPVRIDVPLGT